MKNIIIFGSGGHAKVILSEIVKLKKYKIIGFIDPKIKKGKIVIKIKNKIFKNLGKLENIRFKKKLYGVIGIGDNYLREKICNNVKKGNINIIWEKIISKNCVINENVKIGCGSVVFAGSVINTGTIIGKHSIINTSSSIDHDNIFEDYSSTAPGVVTGGNVKVKKGSFLGLGSKIKHKITISYNTVVGANSFVNKDCLPNNIYFGNPARKIKKRKRGESYLS